MRTKYEIYNPKRDDEHFHLFHMGTPTPGEGGREALARVVNEPPTDKKIACANMAPKHARKRDTKREISPPQSLLPCCRLNFNFMLFTYLSWFFSILISVINYVWQTNKIK